MYGRGASPEIQRDSSYPGSAQRRTRRISSLGCDAPKPHEPRQG